MLSTFTGTLNIRLVDVEVSFTKVDDSNRILDLFVSVDQRPIYQTSTKCRNNQLNESFTSEIEDGRDVNLKLFTDSPKSADDCVANCSITFDEIARKEKQSDGVYDVTINLDPSGYIRFFCELIERTDDEPSGRLNRRRHNAIRKKVHQVHGHKFQATLLKQPSYCSQCHNFIYGIGMQGYKCTGCRTVVHKKCHQNVKSKCKSIKSTLFDESSENKTCINCPHQFEEHHFMRPAYCDHCGSLLFGMYYQGMQCKDCKMICHKRCHSNVPENCERQVTASVAESPLVEQNA